MTSPQVKFSQVSPAMSPWFQKQECDTRINCLNNLYHYWYKKTRLMLQPMTYADEEMRGYVFKNRRKENQLLAFSPMPFPIYLCLKLCILLHNIKNVGKWKDESLKNFFEYSQSSPQKGKVLYCNLQFTFSQPCCWIMKMWTVVHSEMT